MSCQLRCCCGELLLAVRLVVSCTYHLEMFSKSEICFQRYQ